MVLSAAGGFVGTASAAHDISSCTTITTSGTHQLTADVTDASAESCIVIDASDVVLDGQGHTVDGSDTDANSVGIRLDGSSGSRLTNVTVRDLTVTRWDNGINGTYVNDTVVDGVTATDTSSEAIALDPVGGNVTVQSVTVRNADPSGIDPGIDVDGTAIGITFTDVSVIDSGDEGIEIDAVGDAAVDGLFVDGTDDDGIDLDTDGNVSFTDVTLRNVGYIGAEIDSDYEALTVRNVTVENADDDGLEVEGDTNTTVEDVVVRNVGYIGAEIDSDEGPLTVRNVTVDVAGDDGIEADAELNLSLTDVVVRNVDYEGIAAESNDGNLTVRNVRIHNASDDGMYVYGWNDTTIEDVHITDVGDIGLEADSSDRVLTVRNVTIDGAADDGLEAEGWTDTVVEDVEISNVDYYGADIEGDDGPVTVRDLWVSNASEDGILVDAWTDATLQNVSVNGSTDLGIEVFITGNATLDEVSTRNVNGTGLVTFSQGVTATDVLVENTTGAGIGMIGFSAPVLAASSSATSEAGDGTALAAANAAVDETGDGTALTAANVSVDGTGADGISVFDYATAGLTNVSVANTTGRDLNLTNTTATLDRVSVRTGTVSGEASDVSLDAYDGSPPADPPGLVNVSLFVNATENTEGYLDLTAQYTDAAVSGVDESSLSVYRYNGTAWEEVSGVTTDPAANRLSVNVTSFSTFGVFGEEGAPTTGTPTEVTTRGEGPGFGPIAGLVALVLSVAALARRRQ